MTTIIFDFDDTLFDSQALKKEIFEIFQSFNLKEDIILETYQEVRSKYNYETHLKALQEKGLKINEKAILKKLKKINFSKYITPEIFSILEKLQKKYTLILLTFGEKKFQEKKIQGSKIDKYFKTKNIYITEKDKIEILKKLFSQSQEKIYFINDKKKENETIKKEFPKFIYSLVSTKNPITKIMRKFID